MKKLRCHFLILLRIQLNVSLYYVAVRSLRIYKLSRNIYLILNFDQLKSNWTQLISTGWRTKCRTIDCARNTFLLLQNHLTSGTELILIGWKNVPNEEHVQCDHRFTSQPLANEPLHSSQLFDTNLQKARGTTSLCGPWAALHFLASEAFRGRFGQYKI